MKRRNTYKIERIDSEIKKEIQCMLMGEIKDPRIECFPSVSEVIVSPDLSNCKIFVEISQEDKKKAIEGLKHASGFMRSELARRINLRKTPELHFILDDSADKANRIEELLREIHKKG